MESPSNSQINAPISLKPISAWMRLEEIRLSRNSSIPQRVRFHLSSDLLQDLNQLKNHQRSLSLPPALLDKLRYYVLLNAPLKQASLINYHLAAPKFYQSHFELTFDTDYSDRDSGQSLTLLRSAIISEGKISQQIHQALWQDRELLEQLTAVHYWLIAQIMAQLPYKRNYFPSWLVFISLLVTACLLGLIVNYYFSLNLLLNLAIIIIVVAIFNSRLKTRLIRWLKSKLIYHLVVGFLLEKQKFRQVALRFLEIMS